MRPLKWSLALLVGYVGIVMLAESAVALLGSRHAARGLAPGEEWLVLETRDAGGASRATVVAGVVIDDRLCVAANHWPRAWYARALANPDLAVIRTGSSSPHRAVAVVGDERERVALAYRLPFAVRLLTGFPPRAFLRLDPR